VEGAVRVDLHRLSEERSIAYHRAIAERIQDDPAVLERARARVRTWLAALGGAPRYARAWNEVLSRPLAAIVAFLVDPGENARELRQSTPFAGVLPLRERWRLWREVREKTRGAA
jgi:hypothetical protein